MSPNQAFAIANVVAMFGWVLLAVFPGRRWIADVICGRIIPAVLATTYVVIIVTRWAGTSGGFSTLTDVGLLFSNPWLLLAGWVHYLAFDLFVGSWEVQDARAHGIPHVLVLPCLALTFMFGPAGWLLYLGLRSTVTRTAAIRSDPFVRRGERG